MKEDALKIAKDVRREGSFPGHVVYGTSPLLVRAANMIEKLVKELDKQKPLSDEEIKAIENSVKYSELALSNDEYMLKFARAIEERHGIYVQKT